MTEIRSVIIEADGGSRGNPGPAAYGAVLKNADTGEVIAEDGTTIGETTNNVAEYSGLIAGLRMAEEFAPGADIEVRMDSKLVVEQMSGNWKVKHPSMRPLAVEANRLAPFGTVYVWVPREKNKHADRLANEALDGKRHGVSVGGEVPVAPEAPEQAGASEAAEAPRPGTRGWSHPGGKPTTLILVRHGVTAHTVEKRFSGGLASSNPGLSEEGRDQVRATADWLAPARGGDRGSGGLTGPAHLGVRGDPGRAVRTPGRGGARLRRDGVRGLGRADLRRGGRAAPGRSRRVARLARCGARWPGESFRVVEARVLEGLQRVIDRYAGRTVVVVSHVTPIKTLVAHALEAPLQAVFRMELAPASVRWCPTSPAVGTSTSRWPPRLFNGRPTDRLSTPACADGTRRALRVARLRRRRLREHPTRSTRAQPEVAPARDHDVEPSVGPVHSVQLDVPAEVGGSEAGRPGLRLPAAPGGPDQPRPWSTC